MTERPWGISPAYASAALPQEAEMPGRRFVAHAACVALLALAPVWSPYDIVPNPFNCLLSTGSARFCLNV
ncbi:hypothetical protein ACWDSJ_25630 [Nocardia sp. NPDC003482]